MGVILSAVSINEPKVCVCAGRGAGSEGEWNFLLLDLADHTRRLESSAFEGLFEKSFIMNKTVVLLEENHTIQVEAVYEGLILQLHAMIYRNLEIYLWKGMDPYCGTTSNGSISSRPADSVTCLKTTLITYIFSTMF